MCHERRGSGISSVASDFLTKRVGVDFYMVPRLATSCLKTPTFEIGGEIPPPLRVSTITSVRTTREDRV